MGDIPYSKSVNYFQVHSKRKRKEIKRKFIYVDIKASSHYPRNWPEKGKNQAPILTLYQKCTSRQPTTPEESLLSVKFADKKKEVGIENTTINELNEG